MARISADNILFTFGMFAIIMLAYGSTFQQANVQASMNQLFAPWPTFQQTVQALTGPAKACGGLDFGCQASAGVAQATAFSTIPFGLLFFAALILVVVIEAFRLFRGSPSGL